MIGHGLYVDGIFIKLEEDIDEKKNVTINSAFSQFDFPLIIKREEKEKESENQYKNIYQVLKKNILMNLDEISSDTSVFKSKCDYLSLPPILHKKCKDRHLELLQEIERQFKVELSDWNSQKKISVKEEFDPIKNNNNNINNGIYKNSEYKLKECFVKLEKLKFSKESDSDKVQQCSKCDKTFTNVNNYTNHLRLHGKKVFKCSICDQKFYCKEQFKYHEAIHSISDPFPCEYCGKCFSMRKYLLAHLKFDHSDKFFRCTFCDKKFRKFQQLESHLRTHTSEKPYEYVDGHVGVSKENESVKGYRCKICGRNFPAASSLTSHMRVHVIVETYECRQCKKTFKFPEQLKLHTSCEHIVCHCGKIFNSMSNYKMHKKVHENERELIGLNGKVGKPIIKIEKMDLFNYMKKENGKVKTSTRRRSK